jgi:hypothetical protein
LGGIGGLNAWWDLPWCVGGDFNTVHYPSERAGTTNISPGMNDFSDFIFHSGLIDLPLEDGSFTWSNSLSKSRLDRFLFSPSLEDHFSRIVQRRLPRTLSDHFPISLSCGFMQRGKSPFRFENMWLTVEGFSDRIKGWWDTYCYSGTPSFVLAKKLKALKVDLRRWNREVFGDINHRKDRLLESIQALDRIEESRSLSPEENSAKLQFMSDFENVLLLDEITWRQKSRATWLREGIRIQGSSIVWPILIVVSTLLVA